MNSHNPQHFRGRESMPAADRPQPVHFGVPPQRTLSSDMLFRGGHEIGIEHHGALYRLKITRQGKLILNK